MGWVMELIGKNKFTIIEKSFGHILQLTTILPWSQSLPFSSPLFATDAVAIFTMFSTLFPFQISFHIIPEVQQSLLCSMSYNFLFDNFWSLWKRNKFVVFKTMKAFLMGQFYWRRNISLIFETVKDFHTEKGEMTLAADRDTYSLGKGAARL